MSNFIILTDSCCDLTQEMADQLGLKVVPLTVTSPKGDFKNYLDHREVTPETFYGYLRAGDMCKTSAVNVEQWSRNGAQHHRGDQNQHIFTAKATGNTDIQCTCAKSDHCSFADPLRDPFFKKKTGQSAYHDGNYIYNNTKHQDPPLLYTAQSFQSLMQH